MPFLPLELYRPIFQYVDHPVDLYHALFVSRDLYNEVEPCLYHTIVCPANGYHSALEVISRSPRKAGHLRSLDIRNLALRGPEFQPIFSDFLIAFQWMVNLQRLGLPCHSPLRNEVPFIPSNPKFALRSFLYQAPPAWWGRAPPVTLVQALFTLLQSQPELEELDAPEFSFGPSIITLTRSFLPRLKTLRAHPQLIGLLLPDRAISRLGSEQRIRPSAHVIERSLCGSPARL